MKTLTFKYTKADGSVSERTLLAQGFPSDKYSGVDMTMMEPQDAANFAKLATQLHDAFIMSLRQLQADFDVKHNYRQFLASGVSELSEV